MRFAFDHLVHFVHHPKHAIDQMNLHGISAFLGGEHERWGTHNALSYFDLSYIEFLGVYKPELAGQVNDNDLVRQAVEDLPYGERFARVAIRTNDIEAAAKRMRGLGLSAVCPGYVDTDMGYDVIGAQAAVIGATLEQQIERTNGSIPSGRITTPEEVAHSIAFLLTDAAHNIIGESLKISGGVLLR